MKKHLIAVQTDAGKYEHFDVPEPVAIYVRQLEYAVRDDRVKLNLIKLYPKLAQPLDLKELANSKEQERQ
jgi:hypothetical protein